MPFTFYLPAPEYSQFAPNAFTTSIGNEVTVKRDGDERQYVIVDAEAAEGGVGVTLWLEPKEGD